MKSPLRLAKHEMSYCSYLKCSANAVASAATMRFLCRWLFFLIALSLTFPIYAGIYWWIKDDWRKLARHTWFARDETFLQNLIRVQRIARKSKAAQVTRLLKKDIAFPNVLANVITEY